MILAFWGPVYFQGLYSIFGYQPFTCPGKPILQAWTLVAPPTEDVLSHLWEVIDAEGQRHTIAEGAGVGGAHRVRNAWENFVENQPG